jgi:antitoxin (DNA-binding transcriptional repressor) of toxin-antitoxin stability system
VRGRCPAKNLENVVTCDYNEAMRKIGIREVQAGDTILVTNRDDVVAELHPHYPAAPPRESQEEVLEDLARAGEVSRALRTREDWSWNPEGLGLPEGTAESLLDDLRVDRAPE